MKIKRNFNIMGVCVMASGALMAAGCATDGELAEFPGWSEPRRITEGTNEHLLASCVGIVFCR